MALKKLVSVSLCVISFNPFWKFKESEIWHGIFWGLDFGSGIFFFFWGGGGGVRWGGVVGSPGDLGRS